MSVNKVILVGHLGQDPELRYTASGMAVTNLNVATHEVWMKDGKKNERTEWHKVSVWGKLAETCAKYLSKGSQAYIEGRLSTREWKDKQGKDQISVEVKAEVVQFIDPPKETSPKVETPSVLKNIPAKISIPITPDLTDADIPF